MQEPVSMKTLSQETLASTAFHIIQQKFPSAFSKSGLTGGGQGAPAAQLPTYHMGFAHVPEVITNPAPVALVENFHATRTSA